MDPVRTRFVLIETSHAGNVGAVARAMKVMGFGDLVLVRPRWPDVLARAEAVERASGATDVLERARVVATLDEALAGMTHLCATVMTPRDFGPPTRSPRAHFDMLLNQELPGLDACGPEAYLTQESPVGVALLFGSERYGMANEDVYRCHAALSIPTNPDYGSLNIAAAVQLMAYDWRQALDARAGGWGATVVRAAPAPAPAATECPAAPAAATAAACRRPRWQTAPAPLSIPRSSVSAALNTARAKPKSRRSAPARPPAANQCAGRAGSRATPTHQAPPRQ